MKTFTIYWVEGGTSAIMGKNFAEAWRLSCIGYQRRLASIDSFEVDGKFTKVAGQATCKCEFAAFRDRSGFACSHDLKLIGF